MRGRVSAFDDARGLGTIESGDNAYPFHCTQIADGTRTIEVGADVTFELTPGHLGRYEATQVQRRSDARSIPATK